VHESDGWNDIPTPKGWRILAQLQRWVPEKMTEVPQGTRRYAFEFSGIGMARFAGSWFDRDCKHLEFYQNHRLILLI